MAEDKKYGLTKFGAYKDDPMFQRKVRRDASTDSDNLEKKRLNFAVEARELKAIIKAIQKINSEAPDPRKAVEREQMYMIASLKGLTGLFDGLALLADMTSVSMSEKDEKTGEKIYYRVASAEVQFDIASYLEDLIEQQKVTNRILHAIAMKQGAIWKNKKGLESVEEDAPPPEVISDQPIPAGVPEKDLLASKQEPTPERVSSVIKGE